MNWLVTVATDGNYDCVFNSYGTEVVKNGLVQYSVWTGPLAFLGMSGWKYFVGLVFLFCFLLGLMPSEVFGYIMFPVLWKILATSVL